MGNGLLKGKNNNFVYSVIGNNEYKNISTGASKIISPTDAQRLFVIPITLNKMAEKNPLIIQLIERCGMSLEPYTEEEKINIIENATKG